MPVRFARAQQSREAFLDITRLQLTEAILPEDVISIILEAGRLIPWSASHSASRGLFGTLPGLQSAGEVDDLDGLVDQLRARLGPDACYSLEIEDQHTPERAWNRAAPLRQARPAAARGQVRKRPLWLFDPPRPVDLRQLVLLRGPERIHTGWWLAGSEEAGESSPGQARDYYVARHHSGAQCWVFADPWERWFLHGYFS
jgi:protein ImuB